MRIPLILRCAEWLVPGDERSEWMAEWGGEFVYVRRTLGTARAAAFAAGAFHDALWMRRNHPPASRALFFDSPVRCLLLLAALASAGIFLAVRSPDLREARPQPYFEKEKLALVSRHGRHTPRFAEIPLAEYRSAVDRRPGGIDEIAFYTPRFTRLGAKTFSFAIASPNLFRLLGVPASASGFVLTRTAWRRHFGQDPRLVGKVIKIDGAPVRVTGIVSDGVWRLPGLVDGWLLDPERLAQLPPESKGFLVARLQTQVSTGMQWRMITPDENGTLDLLALAPLSLPADVPSLILVLGIFLLVLPATTSLSMGDLPAHCPASRWTARSRWWIFFGLKTVLLLPTVFWGFFWLGVLPIAPQISMLSLMLALRWAFRDQRKRCPVCLHSLSHPVRIGEASHTFLDWYGTELICARGHGFLHVPEIRTSCYSEPRWLSLGVG